MDGLSSCPQQFVSSKDREWFCNTNGSEESNKLDLTLAPPGPQKWSTSTTTLKHISSSSNQHDESLLSFGRHHQPSWPGSAPKFLQFPSANDAAAAAAGTVGKESSLHQCGNTSAKITELQQTRNNNDAADKIGLLTSVSTTSSAVPQKRTAPGPVVGWPPLRALRKNLATATSTNTTKPSPEAESQNGKHGNKAIEGTAATQAKGLFVKINMDGIPLGRKVDLTVYDSYAKLSSVVDKLFRGLLAAQTDSFANGIPNNLEVGKPITGLLDGSGEYTLVYEDNEGDRVLVGDVPWRMFVSTVKRLRVLKTSELPSLSLGGKQQKMEQPP